MKKKMFLSVALIALMAVGAFAQTYTAESNFQVTKTATEVTITRYIGGGSVPSEVNIPPTIQNLPVTTIAGGIFTTGMGNVTSLTIPASVTKIQATAFYNLVSLRSVTFLGTIPSANFNANGFAGDLRAKFYATDRTNGTPGTYTRSGEIWTLTPAATTTTTSMAETPATSFAWSRTADGRGIIINDYTGTTTAVRIPDRISNLPVVEIGEQAFDTKGITSVVIPNTVTSIGDRAFFNAQFTSVTLPTSLVTIGSEAFRMSELTSITMPNTVRTIGSNAFTDCFNLTSVTLPDNRTTVITTIGGGAFRNCTQLTTVNISTNVTRIIFGTAASPSTTVFQNCTSLNAASKTALQRVGYTGAF